jgi:outer membrane protein
LLAKAAKYPNLTGGAAQTLTHSNNANPEISGVASQSTYIGTYDLSSSWTVYNGGYINRNIRLQDLSLKSAGLTVDENVNDLTLQITQDYLSILLAGETIVYQEDLLKTSQAQLEQGKQEYSAGSIAKNALIELEAQTAADNYNLVTAQNAYRQNILSLKQLLQLPTIYSMAIVVPDTVIAGAVISPLEQAEKDAFDTRPEIRNGELGVQMAQVTLKMATAQEWPVATVGGSATSGYANSEAVNYPTQLGNNFYQRIGLTLSIPIFNNRIYKTQVEVSKIKIGQAKLSLLGTETTLSQEVEQAYINVSNAKASYDAATVQLRSSQEAYRVASEQFHYGASDIVDLLQQKSLYVQALQAYIQAKYDAVFNTEIYNFYRGIPVKL